MTSTLKWVVLIAVDVTGEYHSGAAEETDYGPLEQDTALEIAASLRRAGYPAFAAPATPEDFKAFSEHATVYDA